MSDVTTTDTPETSGTAEPAEIAPAAPPAAQAPPPETVPFWQRPLVERFLVPLLLPVAVVVALVAYVLNISRLFLSAHGHLPVVIGTSITVLILGGAAMLSAAAPRLRQSSIKLLTLGFVLVLMSAGWLSLGHSEEKGAQGPQTLPASLKAKQAQSVTVAPGGNLAFAPNSINATTGLVKFTATSAAAGHTFQFDDPTTLFAPLVFNAAGEKQTGVAFFAKPGDYTYFCAIPGHRSAGMQGTVHVTGAPMTLQQAETAAGNPPTGTGASPVGT